MIPSSECRLQYWQPGEYRTAETTVIPEDVVVNAHGVHLVYTGTDVAIRIEGTGFCRCGQPAIRGIRVTCGGDN